MALLKAISLNSSPRVASSESAGFLILVGTPIGNLSDISQRCVQALRDADIIAAEDTRRARALLSHLQISGKELLSIDANREEQYLGKVQDLVRSGKKVAYTTDAGMPGISDPGSKLVRALAYSGLQVDAVPGPSAPVLAAALSGLCDSGFLFTGFLSAKSGPRRKVLEKVARCGFAIVVLESPKRIGRLLEDATLVYGGGHPVFVGRELTKLHQDLYYGNIEEAAKHYGCSEVRGELVVVFGAQERRDESPARILDLVLEVLGDGASGTRTLAGELAEITGIGRNEIYEKLVALRKNSVRARES